MLHLFLMSFFIPDHQNILLSATIFPESGCRKCSASIACLFSSSRITIFSNANSKQRCSVISLKAGEKSSGLSLCSFPTHILSCSNFRLTEVLCVTVFKSIKKIELGFHQILFSSGVLQFRFFNSVVETWTK